MNMFLIANVLWGWVFGLLRVLLGVWGEDFFSFYYGAVALS
jgi:hypothetical protein